MARHPVAIIQARIASRRFPGKVLADLAGASVVARVVERAQQARGLAAVVVAVPDGVEDEGLRAEVLRLGVGMFVGSAADVLARLAGAAVCFGADPIVRLRGDCPLADPSLIDVAIDRFAEGKCDHLQLAGAPAGLAVEVVATEALARARAETVLPPERACPTDSVTHGWADRFRCVRLDFPESLPGRHWAVKDPADLALVRAIYARLYHRDRRFGWRDIEALLAREPALLRLQALDALQVRRPRPGASAAAAMEG